MALQSSKLSEIPAGTEVLTRSTAVKFQLNIMNSLTDLKDRLIITYSPTLATLGAALTCTHITYLYRQSVNIKRFMKMTTVFPSVCLPVMATYVLHKRFVRDDIIVQKWACPTCLYIRSAVLQVLLGIVTPLIFAPICAFSTARVHETYNVPPLNKSPIIQFYISKTKPLYIPFMLMALTQITLGCVLVQKLTNETNYFNMNIELLLSRYNETQKQVGKPI